MSELLVVAIAVLAWYLSTGMLVLVAVERIRTEPLPADEVAHTVLAWPVVGFVAVAGLYAVWTMQQELDEL